MECSFRAQIKSSNSMRLPQSLATFLRSAIVPIASVGVSPTASSNQYSPAFLVDSGEVNRGYWNLNANGRAPRWRVLPGNPSGLATKMRRGTEAIPTPRAPKSTLPRSNHSTRVSRHNPAPAPQGQLPSEARAAAATPPRQSLAQVPGQCQLLEPV
jgi:hypothetical protein